MAKNVLPPDSDPTTEQPVADSISTNDIEVMIPFLITLAEFGARRTSNKKDDELVRRLKEAFADGTLVKGIAVILGLK